MSRSSILGDDLATAQTPLARTRLHNDPRELPPSPASRIKRSNPPERGRAKWHTQRMPHAMDDERAQPGTALKTLGIERTPEKRSR